MDGKRRSPVPDENMGSAANSASRRLIEINARRAQLDDPEWASHVLGRTLVGGLGRPEEVANVALLRGSDDHSDIAGVGIVVDGGMKAR